MSTTAGKMAMSDVDFGALRKIIYTRAGIHFPDNKKYVLESRLAQRLTELELESFSDYVQFLSIGPYQNDEFQEMFNRITINETSFFRNEPQLDVFERKLLPQLLEARKSSNRLRIWSSACSSGEEPFTLAMIVHRTLGLRLADWRIEILGSDISEKVLEVAQAGKYTDYAMRSTPALVKQRYFKQDGPYWEVDATIRSMVNFELLNLKDRAGARRHGTWDVIFCRNVMIYFDDAMKKQVLGTFAENLADDGVLLIGHSETIRPGDAPFAALPFPEAFAYKKTKN